MKEIGQLIYFGDDSNGPESGGDGGWDGQA